MPCRITVQITANAGRNAVTGWLGDRLKIKVRAPALEGRANEELIRFLAETLGVATREITLERGATARTKILAFHSLDQAAFLEKISVPPPAPLTDPRK